MTDVKSRDPGVLDVTLFDVHNLEWIYTSDMDTGRPVWEYLVKRVKQGSLLVGSDAPYSVYGFDWHENFYAQTHFHDVDQIQLIVHGEIRMGRRRLRPGHGVFTPAGRAYNFSTGPVGAIVIELRSAPTFRMGYKERDIHLLGRDTRKPLGDDSPPPLAIPGFTPGEHRPKPVFFDTETCPETPASEGLPWDEVPPDPALVPGVSYQRLVTPPESDSHNLLGVRLEPDRGLLPHRQSTHRIVYGLSGEVRFNGATVRADQGCFIPEGTTVEVEAGPAGARYLEFRDARSWRTTWVGVGE